MPTIKIRIKYNPKRNMYEIQKKQYFRWGIAKRKLMVGEVDNRRTLKNLIKWLFTDKMEFKDLRFCTLAEAKGYLKKHKQMVNNLGESAKVEYVKSDTIKEAERWENNADH